MKQIQHQYGSNHPRTETCYSSSKDSHARAIDQYGVSSDVRDSHHQRHAHRNATVSHRTEESCTTMEETKEWITQCGERKIDSRLPHDRIVYAAEQQRENPLIEQEKCCGEKKCYKGTGIDELLGSFSCLFCTALPYVLGNDYRTSCS